jgi:hypothetical protein
MNAPEVTWLCEEPCPACGTTLNLTDDGTGIIRQDCPACGFHAATDSGDVR